MTRQRRAVRVRHDQDFKGRQFTAEVILWAVRWYLMFPISGCDNEYWPTCADEYWPTPPVFDLLARAEARASRSAALLCPPIMI
jgi:hypothetical protein